MQLLVFSDSHGSVSALEAALDANPGVNAVFLGDGLRDVEEIEPFYSARTLLRVPGNNDPSLSGNDKFIVIPFGSHRLFCTHGHFYHVRLTLKILMKAAAAENCDAALFGHTHTPLNEDINGMLLLNPGSVGFGGTYAMLEDDGNKLTAKLCRL